ADLLPGLDPGALGDSPEGRHAARGGADPDPGRVRPGDRRGPGGRRPVETAAVTRLRHAVAARLGAVLRLDDPPWRGALALAVGGFLSCPPFWGVQNLPSLLGVSGLPLVPVR